MELLATQGSKAEEIVKKQLKEKYAPCEVVKLTARYDDTTLSHAWNVNGLNKAIKKLAKNNVTNHNLYVNRFNKFRLYYGQQRTKLKKDIKNIPKYIIKQMDYSNADFIIGLPDFIIITKKGLRLVEVKSYQEHRAKIFWEWNRMNIRDDQRLIFPALAQKYPLDLYVVIFKPNDTEIRIMTYTEASPIINREKRKVTKKSSKLNNN